MNLLIVSGISFVVCVVFALIFRSKNPTPKSINADALINAMNIGITVAGLMLPILVGIISILISNEKLKLVASNFVFYSIVVLIFSIFIGLYNVYSVATLKDSSGNIQVSKTNNAYFIAAFVEQLLTLLMSIALIAWFSYKNFDRKIIETNNKNNQSSYYMVPILKQPISVDSPIDSVLKSWGETNNIKKNDSITYYYYKTNYSEIEITVINQSIVNINEKKIKK